MDRESWIKVFDRWLRKTKFHAENDDSLRIPGDSQAWERRSITKVTSSSSDRILVAMSPKAYSSGRNLDERVHSGQYLVADPEVCILIGDEGNYFIPWNTITWVRG